MEFDNSPPIKMDILVHKVRPFTSSIIVNEKEYVPLSMYTEDIVTEKFYKLIEVQLNIPFTGNKFANNRSKIVTYFDDILICYSQIHSTTDWNLNQLFISGSAINISPGHHVFKVEACVDDGELHIPEVSTSCIETTKNPRISYSLLIKGFRE